MLSPVTYEHTPEEPYRPHELAKLFPNMDAAAFQELAEDIKVNGIMDPVVIYEGQVLDGRHRYLAARQVGIDYPRCDYIGDDPLGFVISVNLRRRHLTESQRANVAAKMAKMPQGRRTDLQPSANLHEVSAAQAASMLNVSERSVNTAKSVQRDGAPELVKAVDTGQVKVSTAADIASLPQSEQTEIVARGKTEILEAAKRIRAEKAEKKRAEKVAKTVEIAKLNAALSPNDQKYGAIYADPPWSFGVWSDTGKDRSAENHYPTMSQEEIEALPVGDMAADDCVLFMWAVMPQLPEAFAVINAWGFEFKTAAFVWIKTTKDGETPATGMGYWTRSNAEICLLATKGQPPRLNADVHQVVHAARQEHSRKPEEIAQRIERLVAGPYLELFSRTQREGWEMWGNQAGETA